MSQSYDHRRESKHEKLRRTPPDDSDRRRERSRSPDDRQRLEQERQARMSRLRAELNSEESALGGTQAIRDSEESAKKPRERIIRVEQEELEGLDEEEQMQKLLGFGGGFGSTKGQKVDDNHKSSAKGTVSKSKARKYRQYMNRKNGFNRPLEKMD